VENLTKQARWRISSFRGTGQRARPERRPAEVAFGDDTLQVLAAALTQGIAGTLLRGSKDPRIRYVSGIPISERNLR